MAFRRAREEEKSGGRSRNAESSSPVGCSSTGGRGQVERRIRTVARIQWKVMNTPIFEDRRVILKPPLRSAMPLSVARIYVGIPLVAMKVKTPSLCSREMTYCLPGIWVLHRAWRRGIIRGSSLASPAPDSDPSRLSRSAWEKWTTKLIAEPPLSILEGDFDDATWWNSWKHFKRRW